MKGRPEEVTGSFICSENKLKSLEGRPKKIKHLFKCTNNKELKNIKDLIIKHQIKAFNYKTDEGNFKFEDIKKEFEKYENELKRIKNNNKLLNEKDYGLGI